MTVKQMDPASLNGWVDGLLLNRTVIGPVQKGDKFVFESLSRASDLRLDYDTTLLPPKKFLLPSREILLTFRGDSHYASQAPPDPFVLLGVHPYDVAAIRQMDRVFSEKQVDTHYMARRGACTLVALDAQAVSPNNFAGCMGTATVREGWDLLFSRVGGAYLAEAATEKGESLLRSAGLLADAAPGQLEERDRLWESNRQAMRRHVLHCSPQDLPGLLSRNYDHPLWQERAERCFSCGACNVVCPTCYCFDVQDEVDWSLECGSRCRAWDGCLLRDFASVAGGHNFRRHSAERYRHRYYRKAKYLPEMTGEIACVGCGRCVDACVARTANPVEVYNTLLGD